MHLHLFRNLYFENQSPAFRILWLRLWLRNGVRMRLPVLTISEVRAGCGFFG